MSPARCRPRRSRAHRVPGVSRAGGRGDFSGNMFRSPSAELTNRAMFRQDTRAGGRGVSPGSASRSPSGELTESALSLPVYDLQSTSGAA
ncbi:Hypothetical protein DEACI_3660 [Acididesulfobacillus acetoxydans]|uniref:Uncharacterized protein n=1 Tax=Acididesulfobacillus acetoxydans TaxID=1561005 RepID=A0A8S0Y052_9FIRM|nr:Hypothetical protein DEACI_3660 [Acididesulfobacillus acetoxydans]CEJ05718.1 Hypothetical protein DEACI_0137 [Acididesulfobacillus acetoxydans]